METVVRRLHGPSASKERGLVLVGACTALAIASLAFPAAPTFDAWAWLVWGREVGALDLDTTGDPSWKPLPVLVTTVLAPLGDAAVPVWMTIARAGGLLAVVATYRLAARYAGGAAGLVAAALLVLTPDGDPRFLRLVGEGHVAPLAVAFALFAVESHLDGRRSWALALAGGAALSRPEAWPFLGAYATWLWFRDRDQRRLLVLVLAGVPFSWFGGDWWGSGDPFHGADAAQVGAGDGVLQRLGESLRVGASMVVVPAWLAAVAAVATARQRRERVLLAVAAGAIAWTSLVVLMATTLGYAALSRFFLPAAAVVCVLAGIGLVRLVTELGSRRGSPVLATVAAVSVVASVALILPRVTGVVSVLDGVARRGHLEDDLDRVIERAGGAETLAACGEVAVDGPGLLRSAVAWKLDLPLHRVPLELSGHSGVMLRRAARLGDEKVSEQPPGVVLARSPEWVVSAVACPPASAAP